MPKRFSFPAWDFFFSIFKFILVNENGCRFKFYRFTISSDNGSVQNRWQAITSTNMGLIYWCICASLGHNELKCSCWVNCCAFHGTLKSAMAGGSQAGPCPINCIFIDFEIRSKFTMLGFKMCSTDHNEILHTSRRVTVVTCTKNVLWLVEYVMNKRITEIHWIFNSIEISLVGWVNIRNLCSGSFEACLIPGNMLSLLYV